MSEQQNIPQFSKCLNWSGQRESNPALAPTPRVYVTITLCPVLVS